MTFIDPYRTYAFKLEIQGVTEGNFTECSGLEAKVEDIPECEFGAAMAVKRLPGRVEYSSVSLQYGLTNSRELWEWFVSAASGKIERRNISIVMCDPNGVTEVLRWNLIGAWPSEWRGSPMDATSQEAAIELVKLVFETLEPA